MQSREEQLLPLPESRGKRMLLSALQASLVENYMEPTTLNTRNAFRRNEECLNENFGNQSKENETNKKNTGPEIIAKELDRNDDNITESTFQDILNEQYLSENCQEQTNCESNKENVENANQYSEHTQVNNNINSTDISLINGKKQKYNWEPTPSTSRAEGIKLKLIRKDVRINSEFESEFDEDVDDSDRDPNYECTQSESSSSGPVSSNTEGSETDEEKPKPKGKKRMVMQQKWSKEKAKLLRNSGQAYISTSKTGKKIEARKLGDPCGTKCRHKCSSQIGEEVRKVIFEKFWGLKDINRQRDFISKNMDIIQPTYRYTKTVKGRRYNNAFHFEIEDKRVRVCKQFFKATLGINDRPIRTVISKKDTGFVSEDLRGKHGHHRKVDSTIKDGVRNHINSIPRIESHYLRQQTSREYIDGGKTLSDLYRDYKAECIAKDLPHANLIMYSRIFNSEFNIAFFIPKKDRCELCVAYENSEGQDKEILQEKFDKHMQEKQLSRIEKNSDKNNVGQNLKVVCFDLQAVLPVPRGEVSVFYYKSKLNSYNFTISELNSERVECYFWNEIQGNRGANEIGTCLYNYLESIASSIDSDDLEVILYSDNCCGQQKNR